MTAPCTWLTSFVVLVISEAVLKSFKSAKVKLRTFAILKRGGIVISARNYWSTIAYQGYGEGVSRSKIIRITKSLLPEKYVYPDHGFILIVSDKVRLERQKNRGKATETFEKKADEFQQRVNSAYPKIAKEFNLNLIDASGTIEEIFDSIISKL